MFSSAWADKMKEPIIVTINGRLVVNEDAVDSIIESLEILLTV
jgi:hypothetical protein